MVKIKHKQLKKLETISIYEWLNPERYNQELWELIEIKDVVNLYDKDKNGDWRLHNIVEKKDAITAINATPNHFKYEPSDLNKSYRKPRTIKDKMVQRYESDQNKFAITAAQSVLLDSLKLREKGLLDRNFPNTVPEIPQTAPHVTNNHAGTSLLKKSFNFIKKILNFSFFKTILLFIITNIWQFIFWVAIGFVVWLITVHHPIVK